MKKSKIIISIATHLLAFLLGVAIFGLWFLLHGQRLLQQGNAMFNGSLMLSRYSAYVETQKNEASSDEYKKALLGLIETLKNVETLKSDFYDTKIIAHDKAFTYERLARLAFISGNKDEFEKYKLFAIENCKSSGMSDCTFENISSVSKRLEEKSVWSKQE